MLFRQFLAIKGFHPRISAHRMAVVNLPWQREIRKFFSVAVLHQQ
jgi:hypothetical protein